MLLRGSARALDRFPAFRPLKTFQEHVSCGRALCTQLWPRPCEVAFKSAYLLQIRSLRSRKEWLLRVSQEAQVPSAGTRLRMGWECKTCTFINTAGPTCAVCSAPAPGARSFDDAKWTCEACTFVNAEATAFCEICDNGRSALNQSSIVPSTLGVSVLGTSFRPLRANSRVESMAGRVEDDVAVKNVELLEADTEIDEGGPQVASGSTNPKSRKRKAKQSEVIDLSDSKSDGDEPDDLKDSKKKKQNDEEPNDLLKQLHKERMTRMQGGTSRESKDASSVSSSSSDIVKKEKGVTSLSSLSREEKLTYIESEGTWLEKPTSELTVLSYNVWFREDLELQSRLDAIGDVILHHRPHIVFFQEVTETIYKLFQRASWWKSYDCSVKPGVAAQRAYFCMQLSKLPVFSFRQSPFRNSVMGRELCLAEVDAGNGVRLLVATSHLESPCPAPPTWNQMFSPERVAQAKEAMSVLKEFPNVVFGGDMNWDDKKDGPPPLPSGWFDAWLQLRPGQDGFTYDTKANRMLSGNRSLQKRLDRMFCRLKDFEAVSIEMVGTEPIPDVTYSKEKKVKGQVQMIKLPVLASDHFGLLLKLTRKCA